MGERLHFEGNDAHYGVIIVGEGTSVNFSEASFVDNVGSLGIRGVFYVSDGGRVALSTARFSDNAGSYGSAITTSMNAILELDNILFDGHSSQARGALYLSPNNQTQVTRSSFIGHDSSYGGAVVQNDGIFTGSELLIEDNSSNYGGAFYTDKSAQVFLENSALYDNRSSRCGGFYTELADTVELVDVDFFGNGVDFCGSTNYTWDALVTKTCVGGVCK
ncbi:MAG: hypothetical protein AAFV53_22865 [Myxococcota bacterium]